MRIAILCPWLPVHARIRGTATHDHCGRGSVLIATIRRPPNMSARAADNLRDEIDYLGSVRVSEVESVQQKIVDIVRHLEDTGEISLPSGDTEEEYVS